MAIRRFENEEVSIEKPFANEYLAKGGKVGDMSVIEVVKISSSGNLFVIAEDFKGTLYKNSSAMQHGIQAIEYWTNMTQSKHPVCYLEVLSGGKVNLAIDDELIEACWIKDQKGWLQKVGKDGSIAVKEVHTNPLLAYTNFTPLPTTSKGAHHGSKKDSSGSVTAS